ncbi:MAG: hypothetical protein CMO81_01905 [Waddliaceae bacterium]|nr:hypothetical protein [Waddliaceae bacterium]
MRKTLILNWKYLIFIFFFFTSHVISGQEELTADRDPIAIVNGFFHAIRGKIIQQDTDIRTEGVDNLHFTRIYDNSLNNESHLGKNTTYNIPLELTASGVMKQEKNINVDVDLSAGSKLRLSGKVKADGSVDAIMTSSICNVTGGDIGAKTNLNNLKAHYSSETEEWIISTGSGEQRTYTRKPGDSGKDQVKVFLIKEERQATGFFTCYEYNEDCEISRIYTLTADRSIVLNELTFEYHLTNKKELRTIVRSNQGKELVYTFKPIEKYTRPYIISGYQQGNKAPVKYTTKSHHSLTPVIKLIDRGNGRQTRIQYQKYVDTVSVIWEPRGKNQEFTRVFNIEYRDYWTAVKDAYGQKLRYYIDKSAPLQRLARYGKNNDKSKLNDTLLFGWNKKSKRLDYKVHFDSHNFVMNGKWLNYDERGNIIEQTIRGNLSGNSPVLTKVKDVESSNIEEWKTYSTYSDDGFNNKLTEKTDEGYETRWTYLENSSLPTSELIITENGIEERKFWEYDQHHFLVKTIEDNGSGEDINDLKDANYRIITYFDIILDNDTPGKGLAGSIHRSYWDFENQTEKRLGSSNYHYSKSCKVVEEEVFDANNDYRYSLHYRYNECDQLIEERDALGQVKLYEYDQQGNQIAENIPEIGLERRYTYDFMNQVVAINEKHSDGSSFNDFRSYDLKGRVSCETDRYGNELEHQYDLLGRETLTKLPAQKSEDGEIWRPEIHREYDSCDQLIAEVDSEGNRTEFQYNSWGKQSHIKYPDGSEERFIYTKSGQLSAHYHQNGSYTHYHPDYRGRPTKVELFGPSGELIHTKQNFYRGQVIVKTIAVDGLITEYRYDGAARLLEVKEKDKANSYSYDEFGNRNVECQYPDGLEPLLSIKKYDLLGRVIEEYRQDALGNIQQKSTYFYDRLGNIIHKDVYTAEKETASVHTDYNSQNMPIRITDPDGKITECFYNHHAKAPNGKAALEVTRIDALGMQTITLLSPKGKELFKQVKNPWGTIVQEVEFYYNGQGLCTLEKHKRIHNEELEGFYEIHREYDGLERITLEKQKFENTERIRRFTYHPSGELECIIKDDGVVIYHEYTLEQNLKHIFSSDGTIDYYYQYDVSGRIISVEDRVHQQNISQNYSLSGDLEEEYFPSGISIKQTYDHMKRLRKLHVHGKELETDFRGWNLENIRYSDSTYEWNYKIIEQDFTGKPHKEALWGKSGTLETHWDALGRRRKAYHKNWSETLLEDAFDKVGNLLNTQVKDLNGEIERKFSYDDLYQITSERGFSHHDYKYDSINNRREVDGVKCEIDELNQLVQVGKEEFNYDDNGNLIHWLRDGKDWYFSYDALDRLSSVVTPLNEEVHYAYDYLHRRTEKTISKNGTTIKTQFLYLGSDEIGSLDEQLNWIDFRVIRNEDGIPRTLLIETKNKFYSVLEDYTGTIACLIEVESGEACESYRYSAFGNIEQISNNKTEKTLLDAESNYISPWFYTGKRLDSETGLVYFGRRYYLPSHGRWLSADPEGFIDGPNLYAYVRNRTMSYVDPTGLYIAEIAGAVVGALRFLGNALIGHQRTGVDSNGNHCYVSYAEDSFRFTWQSAPKCTTERNWVGKHKSSLVTLGFLNGVDNSLSDNLKSAQLLSDNLGGIQVCSRYNPFNFCSEAEFLFDPEYPINKQTIEGLAKDWEEAYAANPSGYLLWHIHSHGAFITREALKLVSDELKSRLCIIIVGGIVGIDDPHLNDVYDGVSWCDAIIRIGGFPSFERKCQILFEEPKYEEDTMFISYFEHSFSSQTYQTYINQSANEKINRWSPRK